MERRWLSKEKVKEIMKLSNNSDLKEGKLPNFDCPPPNFEDMPDFDKGWIAIAKSVVDDESPYRKIIKAIEKHKGPKFCILKQNSNIVKKQFHRPKGFDRNLDRRK